MLITQILSRHLAGRLIGRQTERLTRQQRRFFSSGYLLKLRFKNLLAETMSQARIQELEKERQQLQEKVHQLVDELESRKGPNEIRVDKNLVFRSKEEQEAAAAMEQLAIKEEEETKLAAKTEVPSSKKKPAESKPAKKGGATGAKEPEKPVDVSRLDLRIGKIVEVDKHPDADALYLEKIDCGDSTGPRTVISGLVNHVPIEEMRDRTVVVLCNLKPAKMRGILSEAMVMCASTPEKVELIKPPEGAKPGDRVTFEKYPGDPDAQLNPKKKIWEQVAPDLKTNDEGVAVYKDCEFRVASVGGQFRSNLKNVQIR